MLIIYIYIVLLWMVVITIYLKLLKLEQDYKKLCLSSLDTNSREILFLVNHKDFFIKLASRYNASFKDNKTLHILRRIYSFSAYTSLFVAGYLLCIALYRNMDNDFFSLPILFLMIPYILMPTRKISNGYKKDFDWFCEKYMHAYILDSLQNYEENYSLYERYIEVFDMLKKSDFNTKIKN